MVKIAEKDHSKKRFIYTNHACNQPGNKLYTFIQKPRLGIYVKYSSSTGVLAEMSCLPLILIDKTWEKFIKRESNWIPLLLIPDNSKLTKRKDFIQSCWKKNYGNEQPLFAKIAFVN